MVMLLSDLIRHRVDAASVPGVATQQTAQAKPAAGKGTVANHGVVGVLRAGGVETAVTAEQWAQ